MPGLSKSLLTLLVLAASTVSLQAQTFGNPGSPFGQGGGGRRPATLGAPGFGQSGATISPYLNLLRSNNNNTSVVANYYGFVRPAQEFNNALQGLQQQITAESVTGDIQTGGGMGVPITGNRVRFQNLGGYFQSLSGGGGAITGTQAVPGPRLSGAAGSNFGGGQGRMGPGNFGAPVSGPGGRIAAPMGSSTN
jgi:hypothetical protein